MDSNEQPELPPEPIEEESSGMLDSVITLGTLAVLAGGAIIGLDGFGITRTRGATQSARLQWSQRQAEIQQVIQSGESKTPSDGISCPSADGSHDH